MENDTKERYQSWESCKGESKTKEEIDREWRNVSSVENGYFSMTSLSLRMDAKYPWNQEVDLKNLDRMNVIQVLIVESRISRISVNSRFSLSNSSECL
jgi:hypothetical protein